MLPKTTCLYTHESKCSMLTRLTVLTESRKITQSPFKDVDDVCVPITQNVDKSDLPAQKSLLSILSMCPYQHANLSQQDPIHYQFGTQRSIGDAGGALIKLFNSICNYTRK